MLLTETLLVALSSLRANKLRSFLTMLGIVIGIAAVIAMIALGNGAQRSVQARIAALGTTANYLSVHKYEVDIGRMFTAREVTARRRVAVLGAAVIQALGATDPLAVLDQPIRIRSQNDFLAAMGETAHVFTALLAGIAAVSLLVGGIGIMNIMLVSVTERTREIGVRKALGATRRNILLQFMIEAVVLCMAGGAVGISLGVGASVVLQNAFAWNTAVSASSVGLAFGFAALVGVLFGVWPARRAASLDPIVALRFE